MPFASTANNISIAFSASFKSSCLTFRSKYSTHVPRASTSVPGNRLSAIIESDATGRDAEISDIAYSKEIRSFWIVTHRVKTALRLRRSRKSRFLTDVVVVSAMTWRVPLNPLWRTQHLDTRPFLLIRQSDKMTLLKIFVKQVFCWGEQVSFVF